MPLQSLNASFRWCANEIEIVLVKSNLANLKKQYQYSQVVCFCEFNFIVSGLVHFVVLQRVPRNITVPAINVTGSQSVQEFLSCLAVNAGRQFEI